MNKNKWYWISFKIKWDKTSPAKLFIDLIIIDSLITPAIEKFRGGLKLWRFHRRATKDEGGHELSLILYTEVDNANKIFKHITFNKFFNFIKENYLENKVAIREGSEKIEGTGDSHWPIVINKTWPYYITGVCDMFINLIKEMKENKVDKIDKNTNREEIESYYQELKKEIAAKWFKYGSHAFLHHLGAIFGYELILLEIRFIDKESRGVIL